MSRYSEFNGYWLFGYLVPHSMPLEIDLLASHMGLATPVETAAHIAEMKFADQLRKAGIDKSVLRTARLRITCSPDWTRCQVLRVTITSPVHFVERNCYTVTFLAEAEFSNGHRAAVERSALVAPHDPFVETCSHWT
jgi:hypothetical protein